MVLRECSNGKMRSEKQAKQMRVQGNKMKKIGIREKKKSPGRRIITYDEVMIFGEGATMPLQSSCHAAYRCGQHWVANKSLQYFRF